MMILKILDYVIPVICYTVIFKNTGFIERILI